MLEENIKKFHNKYESKIWVLDKMCNNSFGQILIKTKSMPKTVVRVIESRKNVSESFEKKKIDIK